MSSLRVPLVSDAGTIAALEVSRLPASTAALELNDRSQLVTLREGSVYRYRLVIDGSIDYLEPAELFDADDATRLTGRLGTGEAVGRVTVRVGVQSGVAFTGSFVVRASKFSDEEAFASMLADLAALSVESLHQGFAASAGEFAPATGPEPRLLYQQFAVLHALMTSGDLRWALEAILARPHRAWEIDVEHRSPGRPLRGSSRLSTQLSRPGPRVLTSRGPLQSLPRALLVERTDETLDTIPNRYVRFVLERWRALCATVVSSAQSLSGAARRRGTDEAERLIHELDEVLGDPLFREVSALSMVPGDNQVLRRREGYREVAAAAALVDGSLGLDLDIDDPLLVSRKSIATLYEYWAFVRLASAVSRAFRQPRVAADLWRPSSSGMSLVLKAGASTRLQFNTIVGSSEVRGDLFFNRAFEAGRESWTRAMRPDASLVIRVPGRLESWLHFDAKYRVDWQQPFETGDLAEEEEAERAGVSKRSDLLKMHAYRDAIRNSAGSYVLFPGTDSAEFVLHDEELLPSLGAFPLRPDLKESDQDVLQAFISKAVRHAAAPGTRHRRAVYWNDRAYRNDGTLSATAEPPVGGLPPADTPVLLGYVRSDEQWAWIRQSHLYNVRSGHRRGAVAEGGPELDAALIVLYGREGGEPVCKLYEREGPWQAVTADTLRKLAYPHPHGEAYFAAVVRPLQEPAWMATVDLSHVLPAEHMHGRPYRTTWLDVVLSGT